MTSFFPWRRLVGGTLLFLVLSLVGACASLPASDESLRELVSEPQSEPASKDSGTLDNPPETAKPDSSQGSSVHVEKDGVVRYSLAWDWSGARWDAGSKTWSFVTSKGVEFRLSAAYSHLSIMQMIPCTQSTRRFPVRRLLWWPLKWLELPSARADHAYDNDTSWLAKLTVEAWFSDGRLAFGDSRSSGNRYCRLHALWTPSNRKASDGFTLPSKSLWFQGEVRFSKDGTWKPLQASIHLEQGAIVPLDVPVPLASTSQKGIKVELIRRPVQAFDSLDPSSSDPIDLAYTLLRRLGQTSLARVSSID